MLSCRIDNQIILASENAPIFNTFCKHCSKSVELKSKDGIFFFEHKTQSKKCINPSFEEIQDLSVLVDCALSSKNIENFEVHSQSRISDDFYEAYKTKLVEYFTDFSDIAKTPLQKELSKQYLNTDILMKSNNGNFIAINLANKKTTIQDFYYRSLLNSSVKRACLWIIPSDILSNRALCSVVSKYYDYNIFTIDRSSKQIIKVPYKIGDKTFNNFDEFEFIQVQSKPFKRYIDLLTFKTKPTYKKEFIWKEEWDT